MQLRHPRDGERQVLDALSLRSERLDVCAQRGAQCIHEDLSAGQLLGAFSLTKYRVYYNKNAYYPYGAVDIDHGDTAPALSAQECKDRCSERADCMCVTQETSTGMCWMRAECDPAGWRSPNNDGYNVFMKV
eukprot:TRINITY_DN3678_c0_g1_i3.p2 TRINITY_DN3678_c0_g1~~TRINITY_DN3678_c0_g1_i3.p2  ORF type:complete len:132 (+),score=18.78 TRINITY_DN3678_c0_g1_i3:523-918(+)